MRLGGMYHRAETVGRLDALCDQLDCYGLSAVAAPGKMLEMTEEDCAAYGARAAELNIVVGEAGFWGNLLTDDADLQAERIGKVRALLQKAEAMCCRSVVTLVGTKDPSDHALAPTAYLYTDACKDEFHAVVMRILDGLELKAAKYIIEPWHNTFFYRPEEIRSFIDRVGHPAFGLHLDQMNLVGQEHFFDTTALIDKTFALLADKVFSVHLKDIRCDFRHMFLKWDEVLIGDGVMDYQTYLKRLAELDADTPCYCEHLTAEGDFAVCFARLHHLAGKAGVRFVRRTGRA